MDTVRASSATTAMASMVGQLPPSPLDATMPVAKTTLLFRADVWNVRRRVFECVRVLADTASEVQMCTEDYYAEPVAAAINIHGINSTALRTSIGCAYVRVSDESGAARIFRLPMTSTPRIGGGGRTCYCMRRRVSIWA